MLVYYTNLFKKKLLTLVTSKILYQNKVYYVSNIQINKTKFQ